MPRHAQTPQIARSINIAFLECGHGHAEESRQARDVVFREVNEALLFTAFCAAGLAFEAHRKGGVDQV